MNKNRENKIRQSMKNELVQIRKDIALPRFDAKPKFTKTDGWNNILNHLNSFTTNMQGGWQNTSTGLGVVGRDKRTSSSIKFNRMYWTDAENLYGADDVAAKVVDLMPQEGMRKGFKLTGIPKSHTESIVDKYESLKGTPQFRLAWEWARLYGGSGILVGVEDGEDDLSVPLDISKVKRVKSLTPLHRWELYYSGSNIINDVTSPYFGFPETYDIITSRAINMPAIKVHHSRLIRVEGARLPQRLFIANYYWHDSVLNRMYNVLRNYNLAHDSCASIIQDFRQAILKIKDLKDMLSSEDGEAQVIKRLGLLNMTKSVLNTITLDNDESYVQQVASVSGLKDLMDNVNARLVAATGLPHTVVLGTSPTGGGLTGKGEAENRDYYDRISAEQERVIRQPLERLIEIIVYSQEFNSVAAGDKEKIKLQFNSLWQMDDREVSLIHKQQAEADQIYITNGVLDPNEVANSRFGGDEYTLETTVDIETRKRAGKLVLQVGQGEIKPENVASNKPGVSTKSSAV